jgi:hypothetical protein
MSPRWNPNPDVRTGRHVVYNLHVHLVFVTTEVFTYYAQRASAGLIIAEASTPNAVGQTHADTTAIHSEAHVAGWRQVTDAVNDAGGRMFLQLQHGGRVGHPDNSGLTPVAPSPIPLPAGGEARPPELDLSVVTGPPAAMDVRHVARRWSPAPTAPVKHAVGEQLPRPVANPVRDEITASR